MEFIYANLNQNNICIGISMLAGEMNEPNLVRIPTADSEYLYKKYENERWSEEKFEPQSTAPLTEFEQLKAENNLLGQQLVDMDLRLLNLEIGGKA